MGILGCTEYYSWSHNFEINEYFVTNVCLNSLYHGIDWMYSFVENFYFYDFRIWYFWFVDSIFDDSFDFFFQSYWYLSLCLSSFQFF
jgi:hypothetical protein